LYRKDRPSLFAFDKDEADVNEHPKRRSNSMGKEGNIEEEKCK
jgi:hypothetical protein